MKEQGGIRGVQRSAEALTIAFLIGIFIACLNMEFGCVEAFDTRGQCTVALGMGEGRIPDHAISASSSYETKSVGPQNGRIRQEKNGGAWCPKAQISSEVREYLEVDLIRDHVITWTETQGRFGNGQGQEFAESFQLEYWRNALNKWIIYKNSAGEKLLTGNSNTYLVVRQELELPFVASRVRFIPFSEHPRTVCMRVELYGCSWEQSVLRYSAPVGHLMRGLDGVDLADLSYDGTIADNMMRDGLGQLVDKLYGPDNYEIPDKGENSGSRWVGWSSEQLGGPLEIIFEFDVVRDFSSANIHCNNMFTRDAQLISAAHVFFSLDGVIYQTKAVVHKPRQDKMLELARNITVPMHNRIGKFVKMQLHLSNRWLLLSEVSFESEPIIGNVTDEILDQYYPAPDPSVVTSDEDGAHAEPAPAESPSSKAHAYVAIAAGALAVLALILGCAAGFAVRRGKQKVALLHKHTSIVAATSKPGPVTVGMKDLAPPVPDGLARPRLSVRATAKAPAKLPKPNGNFREESDSENSSVYHEPYKLLPTTKKEFNCHVKKDMMKTSKSSDHKDFTNINVYGHDDKFPTSTFYKLPLTPPPMRSVPSYETFTIPHKNISENFYAATDIVPIKNPLERREQHFNPGRFTPLKLPDADPPEGVAPLLEFPRQRLRALEKMGEGAYGTLHMCEAEGVPEYAGGTSSLHKKQMVMVKTLWRGSTEIIKKEFIRECTWLAGLRDPNLARVLGLCLDEPPCAFTERPEMGDLPVFLRSHTEEMQDSTITYGSLVYMASQVASGMKYLESLELVHRDLAARNIMVAKDMTVKVSDHAMYCERYESEYYMSDTKVRLPIRWMAWESLLLGKYSPKSDVWSFGVTLWEMLTLCAHRPLGELTAEQVVENADHWYRGSGCARAPPRPSSCPRDLYDLMHECWRRNAADRPRFIDMHAFLGRKSAGFAPPRL